MDKYNEKLLLAKELLGVFGLSTGTLSKKADNIVNKARDKQEILDYILDICADTLRLDPESMGGHSVAGSAYSLKGAKYRPEAIVHLKHVVNNVGTDIGEKFLSSLTNFRYIENGKIIAADKNRVLSDIYSELGKLYQGEKDWVNAINCYKKLTELRPAASHGWVRLAQCLSETHGPDEAVNLLKYVKTLEIYIPKPYPVTGYESPGQEPLLDDGFKQVIDHYFDVFINTANLQEAIISIIDNHPGILQKDISDQINIEAPKQTIAANAKKLETRGIITRTKKSGTYQCWIK